MGLLDSVNSLQGLQGFQNNGGSFADLQNAAMSSLGSVGEKVREEFFSGGVEERKGFEGCDRAVPVWHLICLRVYKVEWTSFGLVHP